MTSYVTASALHLSDSATTLRSTLQSIPASTRRRLSSYAKLVMSALLEIIDRHPDAAQAPVVLASRHGDLQRTIHLLNQLVAEEALSPTQFCLSVNNAVLGQFSMLLQNQQGMTTIGAGMNTLPSGWLEATLQLQDHPQVLLVYADEPPPEPYLEQCQSPAQGVAFAALIERELSPKCKALKVEFTRETLASDAHNDVVDIAKNLHQAIQNNAHQKILMQTSTNLWGWQLG